MSSSSSHENELDDISRCNRQLQTELSDRTGELGDIETRVQKQQKEKYELEQDLTALSHQPMDAQDKLTADIQASERHEQKTLQEDRRLDERAIALDIRQQELEAREADLSRSNETLGQNLQALAGMQDEERKKAEEESAKFDARLDLLVDCRRHMDREVEQLKRVNDSLEEAKNQTERQVANLRNQLDTLAGENQQLVTSNHEAQSENVSLAREIERLKEERRKLSEEKETLDKGKEALDALLSTNEVTILQLQADAVAKSTRIDQFQADRTSYEAERTCLLRQLMADSTRVNWTVEALPKELVDIIGDARDVRVFPARQSGEMVLVRAQRFRRERKASVIIERRDRTRIVWHGATDKCIVEAEAEGWDFCLRLENGQDEVPIEIFIDGDGLTDWKRWLKEPDPEVSAEIV